jgi:hypothetical protein
MTARAAWDPQGFADYAEFYPATPSIAHPGDRDATGEFLAAWESATLPELARGTGDITVVLVRGLFGRWIPGHLAAPLRALRGAGLPALVARSAAAGTIDDNALGIAADLARRVPGHHRLVFLCHSKGGLDLLAALSAAPALRRRTAALVLCQAPRGGCAVLESVLQRAHRDVRRSPAQRAQEAVAAAGLTALGARPGCLDLVGDRVAARLPDLDAIAATLPTLTVASWSSEPSAWLDSQHGRLGAIRPGCAHDGLFWLEDLVWPVGETVLLPRLDHSQPCVGGRGFPHDRLWLALAAVALARSG